ncbi:MAG: FHA domain-containing protein, partial [Chloroflexi bacterium]|nr:FHA domain-containing protein [Chloroflexota bacterium]
PQAQPQPAPAAAAQAPRLVIATSGIEIPLPTGQQVVVGREDPYTGVYPDVDLSPHGGEEGGVSRRHFRIAQSGGRYTVEDLNSTNMTYVNRQQLQPGAPVALSDGDEIRAGRVRMTFRAS